MKRQHWTPPPDPIAASSLCQVVTGDNGGCNNRGTLDESCDCIHEGHVRRRVKRSGRRRTVRVREWWYVSVDAFTGIAVTYHPVVDEETGHELITEPELAELLR